jgi:hypothetical protein
MAILSVDIPSQSESNPESCKCHGDSSVSAADKGDGSVHRNRMISLLRLLSVSTWAALVTLAPIALHSADQRAAVHAQVDAHYPHLFTLYQHLHRHPELSFFEEKTAARVAQELRAAGFAGTEKADGHGVVTGAGGDGILESL